MQENPDHIDQDSPLFEDSTPAVEFEYQQSYDLQAAIGKKLTVRQEYFALLVAQGNSNVDAYKRAYNKENGEKETVAANAYKTSKAVGIKEAIDYFRAKIVKQVAVDLSYSVEQAFSEIMEVQDIARKKQNTRDMLACVKLKSDLAGLIVRRSADVTPAKSLDAIDQELRELLKSLPIKTVKRVMGDVVDVETKSVD